MTLGEFISFLVGVKIPLDVKVEGPAFEAVIKRLKKEEKKIAE